MNDGLELWNQVKKKLENSIDAPAFKEIFSPITTVHKIQNNYIYLIVKNDLLKYRIEKFYLDKANDFLKEITEEEMQFKIITEEKARKEEEAKKVEPFNTVNEAEKAICVRSLRPEYTFDNFVTGEANREAFTFAVKVAESPYVTINPFYIFGDVGLGKSHLMMAIGHYILDNNINANIVYTTAQQFVEDYYKSKNKNQRNTAIADNFDKYYRSADVLLVDDIQYLADRQGSQDEFFKLFEYLFENNKQIVITSDKPASELNIMARLKSRFSWGMQTDIKKPNHQLRVAILRDKLRFLISDPSVIPDDVLNYIAENFNTNVRDLEGALRRFISFCVSFNIPFTLENAANSLEGIIPKDRMQNLDDSNSHIEKAKEVIASYFNINVKELSSSSRKQEFVYIRSVAIYLFKHKFNLTLKKIGQALGGRDHATIAHSLDKIEEMLKTESTVKQDVDNLIKKLDRLY